MHWKKAIVKLWTDIYFLTTWHKFKGLTHRHDDWNVYIAEWKRQYIGLLIGLNPHRQGHILQVREFQTYRIDLIKKLSRYKF